MSISTIRGSETSHVSYKIEQMLDITSYPFYHGPLDGFSCEELLRWKPNGTYLVRDGEKSNLFYLSWVTDSAQCHFAHVPFRLTEEGWVHKNMHITKIQDLKILVPTMTLLSKEQCIPLSKM